MHNILNATHKYISEYITNELYKINILKIFNIIITNSSILNIENNQKVLILCDLINENKISYKNLYLKSNIFITGLEYSYRLSINRAFNFCPKLSSNTNNWEKEFEQISIKIKNHINHDFVGIQDLCRLLDLYMDHSDLEFLILNNYLKQYISFVIENI